jgi:hypothetical protein
MGVKMLAFRDEDTLDVRVLSWMFGGEIEGHSDLQLSAEPATSVRIRMITDEDRSRWRLAPPLGPVVLQRLMTCAEVRQSFPRDVATQYGALPLQAVPERATLLGLGELTFRAWQSVDLLKLVVSPKMQTPLTEILLRYEGKERADLDQMTSYPGFRAASMGHRWTITQSDSKELPALWWNLTQGGNALQIRFPLRRWGISIQRHWPEDQLIDQWIGLESLFKRDLEVRRIPEKTRRAPDRCSGWTFGLRGDSETPMTCGLPSRMEEPTVPIRTSAPRCAPQTRSCVNR